MDNLLLPLIGFAFAATVTPGPNNIMVAASSARHGVRATLPHMLGIAVGFAVLIALVGLGLAQILAAAPLLARVFHWIALAWLLLLAWQIARAGAPGQGSLRPPMGFLGAALFQWVNPKAWLLALSANAAFVLPDRPILPQLLTVSLVFMAVCMPCILPWAMLGSGAGRLLGSPGRLRAFNLTMAVLLVVSMLPVALEE